MNFDDLFTENVELSFPPNETWYPTRATVSEMTEVDAAQFGNHIRNAAIFILSAAVPPQRGCKLRFHEKIYDVRSIRQCRNISGIPIGYRCMLV